MGDNQHIKQNVRTASLLFLSASVLMLIAALLVPEQPKHRMFLVMALAFFSSGAVQLILWMVKKDLFKAKSWSRPDYVDRQD